mmetsp:Transcript_9809/g.41704  ORF Transcript_9809/g.41704 Transcript_9809/m.41704 type:complete len:411 (+) Transcript_9809:1466-2698(+)
MRFGVDVGGAGETPAVVPLGKQRAVGGYDHVRLRHRRGLDRPPVRAVVPHDFKRPVGVRRDLVLPVGHHRERAHDERRPGTKRARRAKGGARRVLRADNQSAHRVRLRRLFFPALALLLRPLRRRRGLRAGQVDRRGALRSVGRRSRGERLDVDGGARSVRRDKRDHLQSLPQAHVVGEDAAADRRRAGRRLVPDERVLEQRLLLVVRPERRQRVGVFLLHQPRQAPLLVREQTRGQNRARPNDVCRLGVLLSLEAVEQRAQRVVALVLGDAPHARRERAVLVLALDVRRAARCRVGPEHGASARAAPERAAVELQTAKRVRSVFGRAEAKRRDWLLVLVRDARHGDRDDVPHDAAVHQRREHSSLRPGDETDLLVALVVHADGVFIVRVPRLANQRQLFLPRDDAGVVL